MKLNKANVVKKRKGINDTNENMAAFSNESNVFDRTNVHNNLNDLVFTSQLPVENQAS